MDNLKSDVDSNIEKENEMFLCPYYSECQSQFFEKYLNNAQGIIFVMEHEYCQVHYDNCARNRVISALGEKYLPRELFPNQHSAAEKLIQVHHPLHVEKTRKSA